ncbi:salicylate hydroxylase [Agrococcus sp. UYP10]|uniref:FAD-dependent oxidoreductase n=1 Tax=Agrococcus sp. UYP10 TaxID=1756355 RepID=UPI00339278FD
MRIVIVGAGMGGLVLAQALREHADVTVVERDAAPGDTGGYRIAITPAAVAVLERHLPAALLQRIRDVSDGSDTFAQFTIADRRLRPIVVAPEPAGQDRMLCQRRALRTLLADGLGDRVQYGSTVVSAGSERDGAWVELDDGSRLEADLVVAADGTRSPTVRSVTATPTSRDLGLTGIAGSAPLRPGTALPRFLLRGPGLALDHRGVGLFLSLTSMRLGAVPDALADAVGPPSLVWGVLARSATLPGALGAAPPALAAASAAAVRDWHPWIADRIEGSDVDRVAAFPFRAASPTGPRFPWPRSRVTALGDAVHAMPPTGGQAGSTAIRDAGWLADCLLRAPSDVDAAVERYQARVDEWAAPAIRESLGPVRVLRALEQPGLQALARPALAVAGAIGARVAR